MDDKNFIARLREIQKSTLHIQQITMELLEELQENNVCGVLTDDLKESHTLANKIVQQSLKEELFNLLSGNRDEALTINEIKKRLPDIPFNSIQQPLCDLLADGLITREMREDGLDKRKNAWAYWKINKNKPIFDSKRQSIDPYAIIDYLPEEKEDALSVLEIAQKLDIPKSTTRDALKRLREENLVQWVDGVNYKNQKTEKYYKHFRTS